MKPFMDSGDIQKIVERISNEISHSYPEREPIAIIAVGNDSLNFSNDLIKNIELPVHFDTVYLEMIKSRNKSVSKFYKIPQINLSDKNVIVVDYCVSRGDVFGAIKDKFNEIYDVKSITFCSLFKEQYSKAYIHYMGCIIPKKSIPYGYGISLSGVSNNEPNIYLKTDNNDQ